MFFVTPFRWRVFKKKLYKSAIVTYFIIMRFLESHDGVEKYSFCLIVNYIGEALHNLLQYRLQEENTGHSFQHLFVTLSIIYRWKVAV